MAKSHVNSKGGAQDARNEKTEQSAHYTDFGSAVSLASQGVRSGDAKRREAAGFQPPLKEPPGEL